jgi:hypothetical protein
MIYTYDRRREASPDGNHPIVRKYREDLARLGLEVRDVYSDPEIVPMDPAERSKLDMGPDIEGLPAVRPGTVGYITVSRPVRDEQLSEGCLADLQALRKKLRKKRLGVQHVTYVQIRSDFKNKGLGKILYEIALYNAADGVGTGSPHALIPSSCLGTPTSGEADRVWKSLTRRYPSIGNVVFYK